MARSSRKLPSNADVSIGPRNAALYARLSILDNGKTNGASMENQIALLQAYAANHALAEPVLYIDNGYTGTDFERPEFARMMEDVKVGKIDCIVVKDLSRLGRNYIETGEYIETIFPFFDVRLVAINDNFDSAALSSTDELSASLKNIVNDFYAKDISRKSASALRAKRIAGQFIGPYAPYGYRKDPQDKNHLLPDLVVAEHVRQIYQWRAEGMGYGAILERLNHMGLPSPGRYRYENGIFTNRNKQGSQLLWNRHILKDILHNPIYLGRLEQGKSTASLAEGIPLQAVPRDQWIVAGHTHEPILDEALFEAVQQVNALRSATYHANYGKYENLPKGDNLFGRKLVCADCGSVLKLVRSINKKGTRAYFSYLCPAFETHGALSCSKKSMRKSELDVAVFRVLRTHIDLFLDVQQAVQHLEQHRVTAPPPQPPSLQPIREQIARKEQLSTQLYDDYRAGILTRDEYQYAKQKYTAELLALGEQLALLTQNATHPSIPKPKQWARMVATFGSQKTLTREMVDAFVETIELEADNTITLHLRYEDEYLALRAAAKEQEVA